MAHLNQTQILDALDRRLENSGAAHLASCERCTNRVGELRSVMQTIEAADEGSVPEPSPLFWDQFPARVSRALDAAPESTGWTSAWRWWGSAVTAAVIILMLVLPMRREAGAPEPVPDPGAPMLTASPDGVAGPLENMDDDEAWAMVRAVAEESEYDQVQESGLSPRAGSVERAALELSDDERAELVRLIEQDTRVTKEQMKRTGASAP